MRIGTAIVKLEKRAFDTQPRGTIVDDAQLLILRVQMKAVVRLRNIGLGGGCAGLRHRRSYRLAGLAQFARQGIGDQLVFQLCGQSEAHQ